MRKSLNKILGLLGLTIILQSAQGQLVIQPVDKAYADTLVNQILLGGGVTASNVQFRGVTGQSGDYQIGYFTTATTTQSGLGIEKGIFLSTGDVNEMPGTPSGAQASKGYLSATVGEIRDEPDAEILSGGTRSYNVAILEFDFIPTHDSIRFNYVFGSEEYADNTNFINYQCSSYNDQFGFLISGPGISGGFGFSNSAENMAVLNNGSFVCINSVNNGIVGSSGGSASAAQCIADNPDWQVGVPSPDYNGSIAGIRFNGNTHILTAASHVTAGQTYHIKILVADIYDGAYDSGVFLEEASFVSISPTCTNPVINNPGDIVACDSYTLPIIGGTNLYNPKYYTNSQAMGGVEITDFNLTSSQTVWIYDADGSCSDEESFDVTINQTPQINDIANVNICDSYNLPAITGSNLSGSQAYYSGANGTGSVLTGSLTSSQTVYIYDHNGTCSDEQSFSVSITQSPQINDIADLNTCDSYSLPTITGSNLSGSQAYYSGANGTGSVLTGTLTNSQTVYIYDHNGACSDELSFSISLTHSPQIDDIANVNICDSYNLPAITGSNLSGGQAYYSGANGTGSVLTGSLTSSQTVYIYDHNGTCSDEQSFSVSITQSPQINDIADLNTCDSYSLPTITGSNLSGSQAYYSGANGTGSVLTGTLTNSQTVYIYDHNGACSDEQSFSISLTHSPQIDDIANVNICDSYNLPAITGSNLSGGQAYYSGANGTGSVLTGSLTSSQTVYIFDANGACTDEQSFDINITHSPQIDDIADANVCDSYTLQAITGSNLSGSQAYYSGANGTGSVLTGTLTSSQTVYLFDANGTCTDEQSFDVIITITPQIDDIADISTCDSYNLPAITGSNLSGSQAYYSEANGTGNVLTGTLTSSQTVYIFDANGACSSEQSFWLEINPTPQIDDIADTIVCDEFVLPSITGTHLSGNQAYYTGTGGSGLITDAVILNSQTIYIFDSNASCSNEQTVLVTVITTPQIDDITDIDICNTYDLPTITGSNLSGNEAFYTSSGGTGNILTGTLTSSQTVYIYDANGSCSTEQSFELNINPNLHPQIVGDTIFCTGSSAHISTISNYPNYDWSTNEHNDTIEITQTGYYFLTVSDGNNCTGIDSIYIEEKANPNLSFTGDSQFCEGDSATILAQGDFSFIYWNTGESTPQITIDAGGWYQAFVNNEFGCSKSDSVYVTRNYTPNVLISGLTEFCDGDSVLLTVNANTESILWNNTSNNDSVYVHQSGYYTVELSTVNNCSDKDSIYVTKNNNPNPTIAGDYTLCQGDTTYLKVNPALGSILWSDLTVLDSIQVISAGNYSVTVTDLKGCRGTDHIDVFVNPIPYLNLQNEYYLCPNDLLTVNAGTFSAYNWSNGETDAEVELIESGSYSVTVSNADQCIAAATFNVSIHPSIDWSTDLQHPLCPNSNDGFINITSQQSDLSYLWSNGMQTQNITQLASGNYSLTITDQHACYTIQSFDLESVNIGCLNIPEGFSPNGDGKNDTWQIENIELYNNIKLEVFNRWGQLMFTYEGSGSEYNRIGNVWDGTFNGNTLPISSFVYVLQLDGEDQITKGILTIVR